MNLSVQKQAARNTDVPRLGRRRRPPRRRSWPTAPALLGLPWPPSAADYARVTGLAPGASLEGGQPREPSSPRWPTPSWGGLPCRRDLARQTNCRPQTRGNAKVANRQLTSHKDDSAIRRRVGTAHRNCEQTLHRRSPAAMQYDSGRLAIDAAAVLLVGSAHPT